MKITNFSQVEIKMASFKSHYLSQIYQSLGKLDLCLKPSSSYMYIYGEQKVVLFNLNILTKRQLQEWQ